MQIVPFDAKEDAITYNMVKEWWKGHGWDGVPSSILPKLGILVKDDSESVCAGWLYMDNSVGVAMLEWVVSNPGSHHIKVARAIKALTVFMQEEAHQLGYGVILTTCKQASLGRFYESNGFIQTDSNMQHFVYIRKEGE